MRLRTQRKVIYATTALVVLALVGGFAAAMLVMTVNTGGQSGFIFTPPRSTIYGSPGSHASDSLTSANVSACDATGARISVPNGQNSTTVNVSGFASCVPKELGTFEQFTFTSGELGAAAPDPADTFAVTCDSVPTVTVTVAYSGLGSTSVVTTHIAYDVGTPAPSAGCDVAVNGS